MKKYIDNFLIKIFKIKKKKIIIKIGNSLSSFSIFFPGITITFNTFSKF